MSGDGMNYVPESGRENVVAPGDFVFAAAALDHGHIKGQTNGLLQAGGTLKWVWDPDPAKVEDYLKRFPQAKVARTLDEVLEDGEVRLVTSAAIPSERAKLGFQVMRAGKDYFTDKSPFTTLEQLAEAREVVTETGRKYAVYYAERIHSGSTLVGEQLVKEGRIGRVLQVLNLAPHRLSKSKRPDWFFDKEQYGGVLTDIGSHQFEQFLSVAEAGDAAINSARVENFHNPDTPGLEDFGEASLTLDNGASAYCRIDWFTPDGLSTWGDGRLFVLGTKGTLEVRKYLDVVRGGRERIYLVNDDGEQALGVPDGFVCPYFGELILDCLNRTENAMTQEHAFKAAELSMKAQKLADEARMRADASLALKA